jgi:hypothetical protein
VSELDVILTKLEQQGDRLANIEKAVELIASQAVEISHLQQNVTQLWDKYDAMHKIELWQASCPREEVKSLGKKFWWLTAVITLTSFGVLIKAITGA